MKTLITQYGYFAYILDSLAISIKRSAYCHIIKYIFLSLLLFSNFFSYYAQSSSNFQTLNDKNDKLKFTDSQSGIVNHIIFHKLFFRINNTESPFDVRIFNDLKKYFRNETVYYSTNEELNRNIFSYNKIDSDNKIVFVNIDNPYFFNFGFDKYHINSDAYYNTLINKAEKAKFYNDFYTNSNSINTHEISVLDFNSTSAEQYWKGTKIWGGIGVGMIGALMIMPSSMTKWEDGYIDDAMANLNRAFTEPAVWDEDHWEINYIGHPVAGSFYYNTIRAQGGSILNSFLFSAFISTGWEYIYEGVAERPSIQDLFVTPIAGAILGEAIHQTTIGMKRNGFSFLEAAFVTLFNPMYVILNGYN